MGQEVPSDGVNFAEIAIVARIETGVGEGISVKPSDWHKCGRCWRLLPEVEEDGTLCSRCDEVLSA